MKTILVTGSAGFIGFHVAKKLLGNGNIVIGIDNFDPYYDVDLKKARHKILLQSKNFDFFQADITERSLISSIFSDYDFDYVIHLAANAGVRASVEDPYSFVNSNILGTVVLLEECTKQKQLQHFVYASSSSVYGDDKDLPSSLDQRTDSPVSMYATTKKATELAAYTYSYLYGIPCTGLRYFTVYGPWGRPDMALFLFTEAIMSGWKVKVFNYGQMTRDFTYVDDVVRVTIKVMTMPPVCDPRHKVYNVGCGKSINLLEFIKTIEKFVGKKAKKHLLPLQPGDPIKTLADVSELESTFGFKPEVSVEEGVREFVSWFKFYYGDQFK